jgi:phage repressor protein C with HTH and peptisase S24 domain
MTGEELRNELKGMGIGMGKIASLLDLTPQGLNFHLRKDKVDTALLSKVKALKESYNAGLLNELEVSYNTSEKSNAKPVAIADTQMMLVPLVNKYAYGGYLRGYGDPEYVEKLPTLPFPINKEYRGQYLLFEVSGDSMDNDTKRSCASGDIVLGRQIGKQYWKDKLHINKWKTFVIVHKEDGILIKDIIKHDVAKGIITLHSLNPLYEDFDVNLKDVAQIYNVIKVLSDL